jgi:hypothetical protein
MTVILDRARQKRCDFQIVEKAYTDPEPGGPTRYEQIFWFTQMSMQQRRPRGGAAPLELGAGGGSGAHRVRRTVPLVVWGPEH